MDFELIYSVARALARELVDQNRAAYVISYEKDHGPIDPQLTARLEALFAPSRARR
jgi:hypothetical protein